MKNDTVGVFSGSAILETCLAKVLNFSFFFSSLSIYEYCKKYIELNWEKS